MSAKHAIILVNVGTPDAPTTNAVRRYLTQFLNDGRVIDLPWLARKLLVNLIIVPFRSPKSAKLYRLLWTDKGSPLVFYGNSLVDKLQQKVGAESKVFLAMRYGNPSLKNCLKEVKQNGYDKVTIVPMFPQYASSSTGTVKQFVMQNVKHWDVIPEVRFVSQFYNNTKFIDAFVARAEAFDLDGYDHILFSYHGLPNSHVERTHPTVKVGACSCETAMPDHGKQCYKATCYETTRLLAARLNLNKERYSIGFQSRLSNNWLTPFTDKLVVELAEKGIKKVLVFAPAFVTDCLETTIEISGEYHDLFISNGGQQLDLVPSLNDSDAWVDALSSIIKG